MTVDAILGSTLCGAVWERLNVLTGLASRAEAANPSTAVRSGLPRLTEEWRVLLTAHQPDENGSCPACSTPWALEAAPCSVWRSAYEHLVVGGLATHPGRHQRPMRIPRPVAAVP